MGGHRMLKEFREFALKGNVVDLAVGVIIGAAFGRIVESLVKDIIMPLIGAITGGLDFSNMYVMIAGTAPVGASLEEARKAGAVFAYGSFLTIVVNFLIVAFALFLAIKAINRFRRKDAEAEPAPSETQLLAEIRDLLAQKHS